MSSALPKANFLVRVFLARLTYMKLFRHPLLKSLTDLLIVLLLVTLAARSEASCVHVAQETVVQHGSLKNCEDMSFDSVSGESLAPDHRADGKLMSMCQIGCSIMLPVADAKNQHAGFSFGTYVQERQLPLNGMSNVPQTPPPKNALNIVY